MTNRRHHLLGLSSAMIFVSVFIYGFWIEPNWLKVTTHSVKTTKNIDPIQIALVSDLHISSLSSLELQVIATLKSINPDIIIFSGDVIDDKRSLLVLESFLSQLPNVKKVATLGNWEHWSDVDITRLRDIYQKNGVEILVNQCSMINENKSSLQILGLDDYGTGVIDINSAFKKCLKETPIILVQHTPSFFDEPAQGLEKNVLFSLAGHTHGGQISLGGFTPFTPPGSGNYIQGWYETKWGRLYVSSGVGTSVVPFRIGVRPEISIFNVN